MFFQTISRHITKKYLHKFWQFTRSSSVKCKYIPALMLLKARPLKPGPKVLFTSDNNARPLAIELNTNSIRDTKGLQDMAAGYKEVLASLLMRFRLARLSWLKPSDHSLTCVHLTGSDGIYPTRHRRSSLSLMITKPLEVAGRITLSFLYRYCFFFKSFYITLVLIFWMKQICCKILDVTVL